LPSHGIHCYMSPYIIGRYICHRSVDIVTPRIGDRTTVSCLLVSPVSVASTISKSYTPPFYFCTKEHPMNMTSWNLLNSIWRHSGNKSMCPRGESFLFCGRSSNTNALTVQQSPPRCQRVGPLGAPCGYTHRWGRRNGPLGSLGPFVFLVPYVFK
jgi:hypothetical protein